MQHIKILGHRGSKPYPENTLPSLEFALKHADGFEFDVQYTKDGIPVVIHDDTVDRTTNGNGRVDSYTLQEIKQLQIEGKFTVPTLEEVMELAGSYIKQRPEIVINVEIKDKRAVAKTVTIIKAYAPNIILSSFDHDALRQAKALHPGIPLGVLYKPGQESSVTNVIKELDPYAIHPSLTELESEVFRPQEWGKPLVVWIYGEAPYPQNMAGIGKLIGIWPYILITNHPMEVKKELQKRDGDL